MRNPLVASILALLKKSPKGISEYDILKALKEQFAEFNQLAADQELLLFRQHFFIMNALYQLQVSLYSEEQLVLSIQALEIKILPLDHSEQSSSRALSHYTDAKLAAYYLDWDEYIKTDEAEVSRLINSFYQRMAVQDNQQDALDTLKISSPSPNKAEVKTHYRKLAKIHHPDVGGNPATFIEIRQAYERLLLSF